MTILAVLAERLLVRVVPVQAPIRGMRHPALASMSLMETNTPDAADLSRAHAVNIQQPTSFAAPSAPKMFDKGLAP